MPEITFFNCVRTILEKLFQSDESIESVGKNIILRFIIGEGFKRSNAIHDSLFIAERVATVEEKEKDIEHFKKYFNVFFSKLALFLKNRNEKITLKVKKRKLYFVCSSGRMTANYKKINRRQNINRKRRNKTNGGMNPTDISTKERRKSV